MYSKVAEEIIKKKPLISNATYDALKWVALILLPALGTLYFALAQIWNLLYANEVVGTIVAFDTFLGVLLGISSNQYNKTPAGADGIMTVHTENEDKDKYNLELYTAVEDLPNKDRIVFLVHKSQ